MIAAGALAGSYDICQDKGARIHLEYLSGLCDCTWVLVSSCLTRLLSHPPAVAPACRRTTASSELSEPIGSARASACASTFFLPCVD